MSWWTRARQASPSFRRKRADPRPPQGAETEEITTTLSSHLGESVGPRFRPKAGPRTGSADTGGLPCLATVLATAASLCACTTVGPNFRSPAAPGAAGYAMAGDPAPAILAMTPQTRPAGPWWRDLGSPMLDQVMTRALADNQTVAAADATLQRARAEEDSARGDRKPRIDANAGAQRERINTESFGIPGFPSPTINLYSIGGTVSYDLDVFGGLKRRVEEAGARTEAQARRADAAYLALTGNVALQAVRIAGLRARIAEAQAIAADDAQTIAIVRNAQAAGGEATSASISGEAQLAADLALVPPLEQELAQARHSLALLVGQSPGQWAPPDFAFEGFTPPATIPVAVPSALVRHRPDILTAEADLHADTAQIGVATADLYPDIRLVAGLTQEALTPGSIFAYSSTAYNAGAGLAAPLFHGGSLRANKRAAEAQARASLAQYRQTVLTAFVQVSDVLSALAHDDERLGALTRAETTARASLEDSRAAYRLGGGALAPVVVAQRQLNRARLARIEAAGQRLADVVNLYAATASNWREDPAATAGPPSPHPSVP